MSESACPRCVDGMMRAERDIHGAYRFCLNCGHVREDLAAPAHALRREVEEDAGKRRNRYGRPRMSNLPKAEGR